MKALEAYAGSIRVVWAFAGVICIVTVICAFGIQEKEVGVKKRSGEEET